MTTVAAMAFDYTDARSVSEDGQPYYDVTDAKLTITPNDDGTYNVMFHNLQAKYNDYVDSFGTFEYKNLPGTTTDGITVIEGSNLTGYITLVEAGNPTEGTLYVKFTETKAYATLETETQTFNAHLSVKYGTDEGWTSTGGGTEEPVVEYPINFDKDATNRHNERRTSSITLKQEGKDAQTLTFNNSSNAYEDHSADKQFTVEAGSELTTTFGYNGSWMHGYVYIDLDNNKQFDVNADDLANSPELVAYSYYKDLNSKGETVAGGVNVNPPSFTAPTVPGTYRIRFKIDWDNVDPGGCVTSSNHILNNGGGIWDATLVVEPTEEPFQPVERTATDVANVTYNGNTTNYNDHQIVVNEYEEGKYKVTYKNLTLGSNRLGDFTIDNVTATDNDGVFTLTTTDNFGTWSDKNDNIIISSLIPDETSEISNFTATLVDNVEDGSIAKLNLAFDLTLQSNVANVVFGQKGALSYSNTLEVRQGETTNKFTTATITVLEKENGKYAITLPSFVDANDQEVPALTFEAEGTVDGNKIVYTAENADAGEWNGGHAYVTIVSAQNINQWFTGKFEVTLSDTETAVLGFGVSTWVAETMSTTAPANITFGGNTVDFDEVTLEVTEDPENVYAVTYKGLTLNGNVIGDFTIKNVTSEENVSEENTYNLTTTDTQGEWTSVTENNALGVAVGDKADIRNFEGDITVTENGEEVSQTIIVKFGVNVQNEWANVVFGEKSEPVTPPTPDCEYTDVVDHGFAPAGESWQKTGVAIDWDTQYIKAEIDLSTCKTGGAGPENVLAIGDDLTGWNNGPHYLFYYNAADKVLQYNYLNLDKKELNGGYANLSKAYLNAEGVVTIELSKKHGLKINGESCLVKYVPTASSPSTNGTESWTEDDLENVFGNLWAMSEIGFGGCQGNTMSNATYNYIHILDLPLEPETKTFDGQLQISDNADQTIVKQNEAQVEITDNFDNTGTITFKNVLLDAQSVDLTFVGTFADDEIEVYDETEGSNEFVFTAKSDAATTEVFGKELTFECQGTISDDDADVTLTFTMASADETINYFGQFGKGLWDAIIGINADAAAGNAQIFTISGAKVNGLQKGINIVRTADGKTIKVVRK